MGFFIKVAGVTFGNRQQVISKLKQNQSLKLIREPGNNYDKFAVAVMTEADEQVGYIPAANNGSIAYRLDRGGKYKTTVSAVTGGGIGMSYGVNIYIEEI